MKEAIVSAGPKVQIIESSIPEPGPEQLVIQVVVSGSNPKDWKAGEIFGKDGNIGDDIAGIVHSVGSNVYEFKPGDRVASFHELFAPNGSFAEYAVGWQHTTFHIPKNVSFEEASTLPLAVMTAAIGLHPRLGLPLPWAPATEPIPLVVYGGASAVGAFAIKLAVRANIHPIIAVAGRATSFVESLIDRSKGDTIIDYRSGDEAVVKGIKDALKGAALLHAFDATAEKGSYTNIIEVLDPNGKLTLVLPAPDGAIPKTITSSWTSVGDSHGPGEVAGLIIGDQRDFAHVYYRYLARGLAQGWFKPHPLEVVPGGLEGIQKGLTSLKEGKASGFKYVFRIADTPGVKGV
ncbi:chaperonin 10-like protein [Pyrenochaeta sp. MPI-SDFR-AT-0127]|nr:chaperonin 10-like protein [Pyrenochaeta sp. MPI-SDFR-AT-0127]